MTVDNDHVMDLLLPGLISTPAGHPIITNSLVDGQFQEKFQATLHLLIFKITN